jgi:hypothetical protein
VYSTGHLNIPERYSAIAAPGAAYRWANEDVVAPTNPIVWVFAILAGTGLLASAAAQQDAADRRRMVEEIDALLASGSGGVARKRTST